MVWTAGFEPATSRSQGENSGLTELRPDRQGRGRGRLFMVVRPWNYKKVPPVARTPRLPRRVEVRLAGQPGQAADQGITKQGRCQAPGNAAMWRAGGGLSYQLLQSNAFLTPCWTLREMLAEWYAPVFQLDFGAHNLCAAQSDVG